MRAHSLPQGPQSSFQGSWTSQTVLNEDLVDFTPFPESEPEEDSGFDFSETEDEEEAAAEDDELSQAAVHGQSATIDLDEDDGLGEALGFF